MTTTDYYGTWRKSSYSGPDSNCVEIALGQQTVRVRDTKAREHGHLTLTTEAWHVLLDRL